MHHFFFTYVGSLCVHGDKREQVAKVLQHRGSIAFMLSHGRDDGSLASGTYGPQFCSTFFHRSPLFVFTRVMCHFGPSGVPITVVLHMVVHSMAVV